MRGTILQPWNYFSPKKDNRGLKLWQSLEKDAASIRNQGYTAVWLPPACISYGGIESVGYSISHWSNFNGTKYGNEEDFINACLALKETGVNVYHDIVHNHLMGGQEENNIWCFHISSSDKTKPAFDGAQWFLKETAYTLFPDLELNHTHFDAIEQDGKWFILRDKNYLRTPKRFDLDPNKDALMGCDLDFDNVDLVKKLELHGKKNLDQIHTDGYRYDAVKHIRSKGTLNFHTAMEKYAEKKLFGLGEYSDTSLNELKKYIHDTQGVFSLFDFPLQKKIVQASISDRPFNMADIFNNTLVKEIPTHAVTFVHSHDDMPQMHGSKKGRGHHVGDWFISQAYALTLLRDEGYPCVSDVDTIKHSNLILRYMLLRRNCTFGKRDDRGINHHTTIGWTFKGNYPYDDSMAVLLTRGDFGRKWLETGKPNTTYKDFLDSYPESIKTNGHGWAEFVCQKGKTSVWIEATKYDLLKQELKEMPISSN